VEEIEKMEHVSAYSLLLWLFVAIGPFTDVVQGRIPHPVWGGIGLAAFVACYCFAIILAFGEGGPAGHLPEVLVAAAVVLTTILSSCFNSWGSLFALSGVACGCVLSGRASRMAIVVLPVTAFVACSLSHKDDGWGTAFNAFLSLLVTNAGLELLSTVLQLRETREELARSAVATERLRFSRDLHDLLGHSMSVIAVKAEVVRRLAPIDLDLALAQAADIEAVSRQALTEIREAVTGYRQVSVAEELDGARTALSATGIRAVVRESGPPLSAQTEALLGWVVREGVTNVIRHSGARECVIELDREHDPVRLRIRDDGRGPAHPAHPAHPAAEATEAVKAAEATAGGAQPGVDGRLPACSGNGLKGLAERLATAGGTLTREPSAKGFDLLATLPGESGSADPAPTRRSGLLGAPRSAKSPDASALPGQRGCAEASAAGPPADEGARS
jgi:two-component system, NarL family, sensor histidine kinase DesK